MTRPYPDLAHVPSHPCPVQMPACWCHHPPFLVSSFLGALLPIHPHHLALVSTSLGHQLSLGNCDTYWNRQESPCLLFQEPCFLINVPMSLQEPLGSPHQLMGWKLGNDIGLYVDSRPWVSPNVPQADLTTCGHQPAFFLGPFRVAGAGAMSGGRRPAPKPQA